MKNFIFFLNLFFISSLIIGCAKYNNSYDRVDSNNDFSTISPCKISGTSNIGKFGKGAGVCGKNLSDGVGVKGDSKKGEGVSGISAEGIGVLGESNGNSGYLGGKDSGAYGKSNNGNEGWLGGQDFGVKSKGNLVVEGSFIGNIGPNNGAPFPRPAYDSGWFNLEGGRKTVLTHNIGGRVENYFVDLILDLGSQATTEGQGISNSGVGGDIITPPFGIGCYWDKLTTSEIRIGNKNQFSRARARVRIWTY